MKKAKKILLTVGAYVLTAALAIGGTVAYLQSEDSDVNVMTLGNVSIRQDEYQRVENADGTFSDELEPFKQGKLMMPYVSRTNTPENITIGDFTATFNDRYSNYIDKIVAVTNTGKSDAYVRTLIALPTGDWEYTKAADNWLHWNTWGKNPVTGAYEMDATWDSCYDNADLENYTIIKINGMEYRVWEFVHTAKLAAGATACPTLTGVYMDCRVNNDDTGYYMDLNSNNKFDADDKRINIPVGKSIDVCVLSQAVQTAGFEKAQIALDTAFGDVTEANATKWFASLYEDPFALVTVLNENDTITNAKGVTVFEKKRTIDTTNSKMGFDLGELELDTAYQFEPYMSAEEGAKSEYADWHADFVVKVDKDIPAFGVGLAGYYDAWCSLNNDKWVMLASDAPIAAGTEIRLIEAMGGGSITVAYSELCNYGNDGIGFLCGAVDLSGENVFGNTVEQIPAGTTITVELRLYEATGGSSTTETGNYITTGVYSYTF